MPALLRTSQTLWLPGFEPPPLIGAVFFAIQPDPDGVRDIRGLTARLGAEFRIGEGWRPDRVLHISLQCVGRYLGLPKDAVAAAKRAGAAVKAPPFTVTFDCMRNLGRKGEGSRPMALCCSDGAPALTAFWHTLTGAMRAAWLRPPPASSFMPHLSLLYSADRLPEGPLDAPITLAVRHFVLVHSQHGETRHKPLGRWPLRG